jgi:hypothetical protein
MKYTLNEEFRRMQKLAGLLNEGVEEEAVMFLNQHKEEIFDKFIKNNLSYVETLAAYETENIEDYSEDEIVEMAKNIFIGGEFVNEGPFIFHNQEGPDDSSIEFTLNPNKDRNMGLLKQQKVNIGGKTFFLTQVDYN